MTFNAFFEENDPETRTTAVEKEDGVTVEHWWSPDDAINVFYGDMQNLPGSKFTADAQANSQTTTFTGSINAFRRTRFIIGLPIRIRRTTEAMAIPL